MAVQASLSLLQHTLRAVRTHTMPAMHAAMQQGTPLGVQASMHQLRPLHTHSRQITAHKHSTQPTLSPACSSTPARTLLTLYPPGTTARHCSSTTCSATGGVSSASSNTASSSEQGGGLVAEPEVSAAELRDRLGKLALKAHQSLGVPLVKLSLDRSERLTCPFCKGGSSGNDRYTFNLTPKDQGLHVLYNCFRGTCGTSGRVDLSGEHRANRPRPLQESGRLSLDGTLGQQMLAFFEERGVSRQVIEACGVYPALVRPPAADSWQAEGSVSEAEHSAMQGHSSSFREAEHSAAQGGSSSESTEWHEGSGGVLCGVVPYRDVEGKEVSRSYIYLRAVEELEALRGRTPVQLRNPPEYAGPPLGQPLPFAPRQMGGQLGSLYQQQVGEQEVRQDDEQQAQQQMGEQGLGSAGEQQQEHLQQQQYEQQQQQQQQQQGEAWLQESSHYSLSESIQQQQMSGGLAAGTAEPTGSLGGARRSLSPSQGPGVPPVPGSAGRSFSTASADSGDAPSPPVSFKQGLIDFFKQLASTNQKEEDYMRMAANNKIARLLAEFPKEIEDVADLKLLREQEGFGMKSFKKAELLLQEWRGEAADDTEEEKQGHRSSSPTPFQAPRQRGRPRLSSSLSLSNTPSGSRSMSSTPSRATPRLSRDPPTASQPANQDLVLHLWDYGETPFVTKKFKKAAIMVADQPEELTAGTQAFKDRVLDSDLEAGVKTEIIRFLANKGNSPNATLIDRIAQKKGTSQDVAHALASHPSPVTQDEALLQALQAEHKLPKARVKWIKEGLQDLQAHPPSYEPASQEQHTSSNHSDQQPSLSPEPVSQEQHTPTDHSDHQPQEQHTPSSTHSTPASPSSTHSPPSSPTSSARSTSVRDPVRRLRSRTSSVAVSALPTEFTEADAKPDAAGLEAQAYVLSGLPCVWHTCAGAQRSLWGVHDVVSFLSREEAAVAAGSVRDEECVEGSGKGDAELYLYLVEDELDRLTLVQLGLPPHAVVSLPPNIRRDYQQLCAQKQEQKKQEVMLPRMQPYTSDLIDNPRSKSRSRGSKQKASKTDTEQAGLVQGERDVLNCVMRVAESVFGLEKCGRVYLTLRNGSLASMDRDDGEFEDALARQLGKDRCMRIRWPMTVDDLPYFSPLSPANQIGDPDSSANSTLTGSSLDGPRPTSSAVISHVDDEADISGSSDYTASSEYNTGSSDFTASSGAVSSLPAVGTTFQQHGASSGSATGVSFSPAHQQQPLRMSANEVLLADGAAVLVHIMQYQAKNWPIEGLHNFSDFYETIMQDYHDRRCTAQGASTGWPFLDQSYRVVPGELTIVTGVPNSGKSEWLDALCMKLAKQADWAIAMCSFEKNPKGHARHLLEKYVEKPFVPGLEEDGQELEQMSEEEVIDGMYFLDTHFMLIRHAVEDKVPIEYRETFIPPGTVDSPQGQQEAAPTIDWVLDKADAAVKRYNIKGLVIDPYNELDHTREFESETEYVSQMLSKVKRFAQRNSVHVWFVAHPRQLYDYSSGRPPSLYDISSSAHFYNKADAGIVVHRPSGGQGREQEHGPDLSLNPVHIYVRKMRNKSAGKQGESVLLYKRSIGVYEEPDSSQIEQWIS